MTPSGFTRRAVIDVGTNSVKLLIADVREREVRPVREESKQTRLGRGFYEKQRLQSEAIASTAVAVGEFAAAARQSGARAIRVIATSAARDAQNAGELSAALDRACGLKTEIISGEREADWAFRGVTSDPRFSKTPLLLLDVGGGSTELILGKGEEKAFCKSCPLGAVRLMEKIPHSDPPKQEELAACRTFLKRFLDERIKPEIVALLRGESQTTGGETVQLVGTGGTSTILARMELQATDFNRERLEGVRLSLRSMRQHVETVWGVSLAERKQLKGLPANRADVILTGSVICEGIMEGLGFDTFQVSTRGLRFAALMDMPSY